MVLFLREVAEIGCKIANVWRPLEGVARTVEFPDPEKTIEALYPPNSFKAGLHLETKREYSGRLHYYPSAGRLWQYALGAYTASSATTPGKLTISSPLPTMNIESRYKQTNTFTRQWNAIVNRAVWRAEAEGIFEAELELVSKSVSTGSFSSISGTPPNPIGAYTTTVSLDGTTLATVTRVEVELNNNLETKYYLKGQGNANPTDIIDLHREIRARVTINPEDFTVYDKLLGTGITHSLLIRIERDANNYTEFSLANGVVRTGSLNIPEAGLVDEEFEIVFRNIEISLKGNFEKPFG